MPRMVDKHKIMRHLRYWRTFSSDTGYVPTMEELGQLIQCSTTGAARRRLEKMHIVGAGTRLTPEERQKMQAGVEQMIEEEQLSTRQMSRPPGHSGMFGRPRLRWVSAPRHQG